MFPYVTRLNLVESVSSIWGPLHFDTDYDVWAYQGATSLVVAEGFGHQDKPDIALLPDRWWAVVYEDDISGTETVFLTSFSTQIFTDGFESGDTLMWSSQVP